MFFDTSKIFSKKDLVAQYKELSKIHHPNAGGNHEDFIKLHDEYMKLQNDVDVLISKSSDFKEAERNDSNQGMMVLRDTFDGDYRDIDLRLAPEVYERGAFIILTDRWMGEQIKLKLNPGMKPGMKQKMPGIGNWTINFLSTQ